MPLTVLSGTNFGSASKGVSWFREDTLESFSRDAAELGLLRLAGLCQVVVSAGALLGPLLERLMFGATGAAASADFAHLEDVFDPLVEADAAVALWAGASGASSATTH